MYQYIISPYNNNKYSINKTIGRKILKKYINNLIGRGTNQLNRRIGSTAKYMNDLSNLKYFYTRGLLTCSFIVIYKKKENCRKARTTTVYSIRCYSNSCNNKR